MIGFASRERSFDRHGRVIRLPIALENREDGEVVVLRHVVLLRWKPGTSDADLQAIRLGLAELPAAICRSLESKLLIFLGVGFSCQCDAIRCLLRSAI